MGPLEYHDTLARRAQAWANYLVALYAAGRGSLTHDPDRTVVGFTGSCGENLSYDYRMAMGFGPYVPKHTTPVIGWAAEIQHWDVKGKRPKGSGKTGHFTQMIWRATRKVGGGFALIQSPADHYHAVWVCKYHPAGNDESQYAANM